MAVLLTTSLGEMRIQLHTAEAPCSARNFAELVRSGYFDGCALLYVRPGYVVSGDPHNGRAPADAAPLTGMYEGSGPPVEVSSRLSHATAGAVGVWEPDGTRGSAPGRGARFYVTTEDAGGAGRVEELDGKWSMFGQVTDGVEVLSQLAAQRVDGKGRPKKAIFQIFSASLESDPWRGGPTVPGGTPLPDGCSLPEKPLVTEKDKCTIS